MNKYRIDGIKGSRTAFELKEIRRSEAQTRQEYYNSLSKEQKIALINSRQGQSKRERERLEKAV